MNSPQENIGPGTTANVIAGIASFFFPGLGQLVQGRLLKAALHFILCGLLWLIWLGWILHLWSAYEAARYRSPDLPPPHELH